MSDFRWEPGFENRALRDGAMRDPVLKTATRIAGLAVGKAPSTKKQNWNKIRKNIKPIVYRDAEGWYANVIVEDNNKVRHAMLLERGWTDLKGRRHPGRWYLKRALEQGRIN